MEEKSVLDTYEQKRQWVRQFNLTSDLFAGKYLRIWRPARSYAES